MNNKIIINLRVVRIIPSHEEVGLIQGTSKKARKRQENADQEETENYKGKEEEKEVVAPKKTIESAKKAVEPVKKVAEVIKKTSEPIKKSSETISKKSVTRK